MFRNKITYNPKLSIAENAQLNNVSESTIRRFVQYNNIDRRNDKKKIILYEIKKLKCGNSTISVAELQKITGYSRNTILKYLSIDEVQTNDGKVSSLNLTKKMNVITSVADSQDEILRGIMTLYNDCKPFDCDLTYSIGNFYRKVPAPIHKYDKYPQIDDVKTLDEAYDLAPNSFGSVVVDLPFIIHNEHSYTKMCDRFNNFSTPEELFKANDEMLDLSYRLLKKRGLLIIKTMDVGWCGKQYWVSNYILNKAEEIGYEHIDTFILNPKTKIIFNAGITQHCARKWHSYFYVFRK